MESSRPGIEPVSSALQGCFLATGSSGKTHPILNCKLVLDWHSQSPSPAVLFPLLWSKCIIYLFCFLFIVCFTCSSGKVMVLIDENFEMYLCHEDGAPMIGISDLVKEIPKTSPCKNYSEKYTTRKKVLPWPYWHLDLGLPAPRTGWSKLFFFVSHPVCSVFW